MVRGNGCFGNYKRQHGQEIICQEGFHLGKIPLGYPSAKTDETVNGDAESTVYLDR